MEGMCDQTLSKSSPCQKGGGIQSVPRVFGGFDNVFKGQPKVIIALETWKSPPHTHTKKSFPQRRPMTIHPQLVNISPEIILIIRNVNLHFFHWLLQVTFMPYLSPNPSVCQNWLLQSWQCQYIDSAWSVVTLPLPEKAFSKLHIFFTECTWWQN